MSVTADDDGVPAPSGKSGGWREFLTAEDSWAIFVAFFLIGIGALNHFSRPLEKISEEFEALDVRLAIERERAPFRTLQWHQLSDAKTDLKRSSEPTAKKLSAWLPELQTWTTNPVDAFLLSEKAAASKSEKAQAALSTLSEKASGLKTLAAEAESAAEAAGFLSTELNAAAESRIREYRAQLARHRVASRKANAPPYNLLGALAVFGLAAALVLAAGVACMGRAAGPFLRGFGLIYLLAILAFLIASQADVKAAGFGDPAWAILLGLLISNTIGTPRGAVPAVQTEYYIKIGLVLLGVEILFGKILVIGLPGIFVAWVVTPIVFILTYLFGQYLLKIPSRSLNLTLSADMSVCGVSAAIATAAACRAKKEELTLAIGISLIFTSIMMIVMPNVIQMLGMDPVLGGAWIGGTIDATGAVVAAGAFLGDQALYVAATIKMIQNILIGVIAFFVAVYWVTCVERSPAGERPSAAEIWRRFPKFVLGFLAASIVFSAIYEALGSDLGETLISNGLIQGWTKTIREWCFSLAFVSIGLATNFRSLCHHLTGGKPVVLYVCGQALNLALTLGAAYLMFRVIFTDVAERL